MEGLSIQITDNFLDIAQGFGELKDHHILNGARRAVNRTLVTMRLESIIMLKDKIKLNSSTLKQKHVDLQKASGDSLETLAGYLLFSKVAIPLIDFVKGSKSPIKQQGIKVKKRRKLKVEVVPGRKFVLHRAFIQRVNTTQVFIRGGSGKFEKQSAPSVGSIIEKQDIGKKIIDRAAEVFQANLIHEYDARLKGLVNKLSRASVSIRGGQAR